MENCVICLISLISSQKKINTKSHFLVYVFFTNFLLFSDSMTPRKKLQWKMVQLRAVSAGRKNKVETNNIDDNNVTNNNHQKGSNNRQQKAREAFSDQSAFVIKNTRTKTFSVDDDHTSKEYINSTMTSHHSSPAITSYVTEMTSSPHVPVDFSIYPSASPDNAHKVCAIK